MADDSVPRATRCGLAGRNVPADKPSEPMDTKVLEALVESDSEHGCHLGYARMTVYRHIVFDYMMSIAHI
jgi:hypothetical protein